MTKDPNPLFFIFPLFYEVCGGGGGGGEEGGRQGRARGGLVLAGEWINYFHM